MSNASTGCFKCEPLQLATQHGAAKLELSERHRTERKALQARYKPLTVYAQWKDQPLIVGVLVLPLTDQQSARDRQPPALAQILRSLSHHVDSRNHITYQLAGKSLFRDEGRSIKILDLTSDQGIAAALVTAQLKFGNVLTLTGSQEFQRDAVSIAVAQGLTCRFADPELEALRAQLQTEKYVSERAAASARNVQPAAPHPVERPPKEKKKQKDLFLVAETHATEPHQVTALAPAPYQISAYEWATTRAVERNKSMVADTPENGKVAHTVIHIAPDGVVLDKGRTVAVYAVPDGQGLNVGDKVVIDEDKKLHVFRAAEIENKGINL